MGIHNRLPGINWKVPTNSDNLEWHASVVEAEVLEGRKLIMNNTDFGIVADKDPSSLDGTDTTQPLMVQIDEEDPTRAFIYPGEAVTATGHRIVITEQQTVDILSVNTLGSQTVIYLEYQNEESIPLPVPYRTGDINSRRDVVSEENLVKSILLANYTGLDSSVKERIVVLAVSTIQEVDEVGTLEPVLDLSQSNFSFNRPWFSPVDKYHRNQMGSGTPTSNNPHGTELSDLVITGDLTLYQAMLGRGLILAPSESLPYVPGSSCTETIPGTRFQEDTDGSVTGLTGARYVSLIGYPIALGACVEIDGNENTDSANLLGIRQVKNRGSSNFPTPGRTNIVYVGPDEVIDTSATYELRYTCVKALEPPSTFDTDPEMTFGSPVSREVIIADGLAFGEVDNPILSTENLGPIPRQVWVVFDDENELVHLPQVLLPFSRLEDADSDTFTISSTPLGSGKIRVWLTEAIPGSTLDVTLQLSGEDSSGTSVSQNITFGSSWSDNPAPASAENPDQSILVDSIFAKLDTVTISNRVADGPDSAIVVEFIPEGVYEDTPLDHALPVSSIFWDGYRALRLTDEREVVVNLLQAGPSRARTIGESLLATYSITGLTGGVLNLTMAEDADQSFYSDQILTRRWSARGFKGAEDLAVSSADPKGTDSLYYTRAFTGINEARWLMILMLGDPTYVEGGGSAQFRYTTTDDPGTWSSWEDFETSPLSREEDYPDTDDRPIAFLKYLPDMASFQDTQYIHKFQVRFGGDWKSMCLFQSNVNIPVVAFGGSGDLLDVFKIQHWGPGTAIEGQHKEIVITPVNVGSSVLPGRLLINTHGSDVNNALQIQVRGEIGGVNQDVFTVDVDGDVEIAGETITQNGITVASGDIEATSGDINAVAGDINAQAGVMSANNFLFNFDIQTIHPMPLCKLEEVIRTADALLTTDTFWLRGSVNFGSGLDTSIALLDGSSAFLAVNITSEARNDSNLNSVVIGLQHDGGAASDFTVKLQSAPLPGSGSSWTTEATNTVSIPTGSRQVISFDMGDTPLTLNTKIYRLMLENDSSAEVGIYSLGLIFENSNFFKMFSQYP